MKFNYHNLPIPGGGFVTGFAFHPKQPDLCYARTDIGGTYRFDPEKNAWVSLIDHVTDEDLSETFPLAIALDPNDPKRLYIACGVSDHLGKNGKFCVSEDYGNSFTYYEMPCQVHGNNPGRGAGTRLCVDPSNSDTLYFASQSAGLLVSHDRGAHFSQLPIIGSLDEEGRKRVSSVGNIPIDALTEENNTIFVFAYPNTCNGEKNTTLVVSVAGIQNGKRNTDGTLLQRGYSLFVSYDGGAHFSCLDYPNGTLLSKEVSLLSGRIGHRYDCDGENLYITLSATGRWAYIVESGYSADCGDAVDGKVLSYPIDAQGHLGNYNDISPDHHSFRKHPDCNYDFRDFDRNQPYLCGFGGISSCASQKGLLAVSSLCEREHGDIIFISKDYGKTWDVSLYDLCIGNLHFHAPYMKPEYNGGHSLIHWISDVKLDPFHPDHLLFNTGTGIFHTTSFTQEITSYEDFSQGIEETVHLNVYSPCKGEVCAIDIVGDLGGFAFTDPNKPCENSFADAEGNRYITCMNADFSDYDPMTVVVTPRGNWTGKTCGGLILSKDQCKHFDHLPLPMGISEKIDTLLEKISHPNNNSGWVALSCDSKQIVWSIADGPYLPSDAIVVSKDLGQTFQPVIFYDLQGNPLQEVRNIKVFADRTNADYFYGFGEHSQLYVSSDKGLHFHELSIPKGFPIMNLAAIDVACKAEIRFDAGKQGVCYISTGATGLWKLTYDFTKDAFFAAKLSKDSDSVYRVGLGILSKDADYLNSDKVLYVNASIDNVYGFYRSFDDFKTVERINDDTQMFGEIISIAGDAQVPDRFYLATGSRGLIMGSKAL